MLGLGTNTGFLRALLADPDVRAGRLDTGLVGRRLEALIPAGPPPDILPAAAVLALAALEPSGNVVDPFDVPGGWRVGEPAWTAWRMTVDGTEPVEVRARGRAADALVAVGDADPVPRADRPVASRRAGAGDRRRGHPRLRAVALTGDTLWLGRDGHAWAVREQAPLDAAAAQAAAGSGGPVVSPMPGTVTAVEVAEGQAVTAGQRLVVVEAMKMEHVLAAPVDGTVRDLRAKPGGDRGQGRRAAGCRARRSGGARVMDLTLSQEHASLRATVEDFARKEVAPVIGELYERGEFPYEIVAKMGAMGLFGLPIAEEYGGMGGDYFALCLALEELARVDSSVAITLEAGVSLGAMPIYRFGTEAQKQRWLPALAAGEKLGAFGLTEPGGGSDAGATRTTARLDGEEWVINGSKAFITNSGTDITACVTVTALTGERQISSIIVPAGTPGFRVAPKYSKVGWSASDTRELSFDDVPGARGEPARRARPRLRAVPADPGRGPHRDRRAGHRAGPGLRGRVAALRPRAGGVRPPDRALPGHPVHDRRHGGARAHRAAGLLRRGRQDARAASRSRRRRPSPSWCRPTRPWTTPARPPRSSAATGS